MQIKELEKWIDEINFLVSKNFGDKNDEASLTVRMVLKIGEEFGELSEAALFEMGSQRKSKQDKFEQDLFKKELADVIVSALTLARYKGYSLEELLVDKLRYVQERFEQEK